MDEHRDDLDTWLSVRVQPMLPSPGTFEAIQSQARRRRRRKAILSAAGAVAAAAVAVAVIPQVVPGALHAGQPPVAASRPSASIRPTPSASPAASPPTPAAGVLPGLAPPPLSVTFVGTATGWVLGQSTSPARCDLPTATGCLVMERTDTGGGTWARVRPPPAHGPSGATGVSQIRFLNTVDGWAFGPQLWATHDGGQTWQRIHTRGLRVTALETRGQQVFAVWARCTGTGPAFAAQCTSFAVYSSPASTDQWAAEPGAAAGTPLRNAAAATLVLNGTTAYLLAPQGVLLAGPLTGGAWQPVSGAGTQFRLPCRPGAAQPDGQPGHALLAADAANDLALLCTGRSTGSGQRKTVYFSQDGGQSWHRSGAAPAAGTAMSLSVSPSGTLVLATSLGIETSADGGAIWATARAGVPPGGFVYVGMTTDQQGVAVPADPGQHTIWFTYNGARVWRPSPVG
jgi:hypothetical protein